MIAPTLASEVGSSYMVTMVVKESPVVGAQNWVYRFDVKPDCSDKVWDLITYFAEYVRQNEIVTFTIPNLI